ncbi:hypothetical protein GBA52_005758, partial [Prunus armeniaca]
RVPGTWNPSTDKRSAICCSNKPAFFVAQRRLIFSTSLSASEDLYLITGKAAFCKATSPTLHSATGVKNPQSRPNPKASLAKFAPRI